MFDYIFHIKDCYFFSKINSIFQTYPSEYHWWVEAVQIVDY